MLVIFLLRDGEIDAVGIVATGAAKGVRAITLYLGITSIIDDITGGSGTPSKSIEISATAVLYFKSCF